MPTRFPLSYLLNPQLNILTEKNNQRVATKVITSISKTPRLRIIFIGIPLINKAGTKNEKNILIIPVNDELG